MCFSQSDKNIPNRFLLTKWVHQNDNVKFFGIPCRLNSAKCVSRQKTGYTVHVTDNLMDTILLISLKRFLTKYYKKSCKSCFSLLLLEKLRTLQMQIIWFKLSLIWFSIEICYYIDFSKLFKCSRELLTLTILIFYLRLVLAVALASSHKNTTFELKKINDNRTAFGLYLISILKVNNKRPMGHIAHRSNDNYFNQ